ncbi:MAG: VWA domain-containing protein [Rikenellaceae bacterium]
MLRLAQPEFLYLLLLLPALVAIYIFYRLRQRRLIARFGELELLAPLMRGYSPRMATVRFTLLLCAIALLIVALARPQTGSKLREVKQNGSNIMLVVDVSRSMLAEDYAPNRLERTKYAISRLLEKLEDESVGMVVFAGDAYVQLPITSDFTTAANFVRSLSTDMVSRQGTSIERAIEVAALAMPQKVTATSEGSEESTGVTKSRTIILITDGESHDDNPQGAAEAAAQSGITIHTIGIGTPEGTPITIGGEMVKDAEGQIVVSKLNESMLSEVAGLTNGIYVRSSESSVGLNEIFAQIKAMEKSETTSLIYDQYAEQFHYILYIVLGLLVLQFFLPNHKRK